MRCAHLPRPSFGVVSLPAWSNKSAWGHLLLLSLGGNIAVAVLAWFVVGLFLQ
jgi:hypothetical protein